MTGSIAANALSAIFNIALCFEGKSKHIDTSEIPSEPAMMVCWLESLLCGNHMIISRLNENSCTQICTIHHPLLTPSIQQTLASESLEKLAEFIPIEHGNQGLTLIGHSALCLKWTLAQPASALNMAVRHFYAIECCRSMSYSGFRLEHPVLRFRNLNLDGPHWR